MGFSLPHFSSTSQEKTVESIANADVHARSDTISINGLIGSTGWPHGAGELELRMAVAEIERRR
jgi:hypothetical protein